MGRPCLLTDELQKKFCDAVRSGLPLRYASGLCGISEATSMYWRRIGSEEDRDDKYSRFFNAVQDAKAAFIKTHVANITKHSMDDWRASSFLLERMAPKEFGKKTESKVEVSGPKAEELRDIAKEISDTPVE